MGWPWTVESPPTPPSGSNEACPKVSIVTSSYNQGQYIEEMIRSVLLQAYPSLEFIIMDGASTDNSVEIIRKYAPWIAYWVSEPDKGPVFASKRGIEAATGTLIGMMCTDDFYMPGGIQKLVALRNAYPASVAWIGACQVLEDGRIVDRGLPFIHSPDRIGDWGAGAWFNSEACLFDAACYRAVGGLDENFTNGNDVDLWIKMRARGPFSLTDELIASYRCDLQSVSNRDHAMELSSWIASNYMHGHPETARAIVARYGERRASEVIRRLPVGYFARLKARPTGASAGRRKSQR